MRLKSDILGVCNSLLAFIEKDIPVNGLGVEFSNAEPSSQLNGLFFHMDVHGMLRGKDSQRIDMVFPSICTYMD